MGDGKKASTGVRLVWLEEPSIALLLALGGSEARADESCSAREGYGETLCELLDNGAAGLSGESLDFVKGAGWYMH